MNPILLVTPPFTQLNTPYPATAYLTGFLKSKQVQVVQADLGIEVILKLFSKDGLLAVFEKAEPFISSKSENSQLIFGSKALYLSTVEPVIGFLQGKNQTLAHRIISDYFLPRASRFNQLKELDWAFTDQQLLDKAKFMATLYLEDLCDFIEECIDPDFGFSRYAEHIGRSAHSFDALYQKLHNPESLIDTLSLSGLNHLIQKHQPLLVCFSVPFPGNLYSAFKGAQFLKDKYPHIKTLMGGGFVNTELRSLTDVRVMSFFDFITLDDGELPLELISAQLKLNGKISSESELKRTYLTENNKIILIDNSSQTDYHPNDCGAPSYEGLNLDHYLSVMQNVNPMHNLWSDGQWLKLTLAHGCYWAKCAFCDISLDYISHYKPASAKMLVDKMEQLIAETGRNGFHFVDEAAPPSLLRELALEIINRKLIVSWWTNIRFEKSYSYDLCQLLRASGCIAVSGGLEVASDRLLKLINKGVTVEQVAKVTGHFTQSGIMVHAYLMYGFPTQTIQETIDSLEMVRQLFECGLIQSGFWHRFALTTHSAVCQKPDQFGIKIKKQAIAFADNDVLFTDKTGIDHSLFDYGLKKSIYNYMHGVGFDLPLQNWFETKMPRTTIAPNYIQHCIESQADFTIYPEAKILWLGIILKSSEKTKSKKGQSWVLMELTLSLLGNITLVSLDVDKGQWLINWLNKCSLEHYGQICLNDLKQAFESELNDDFEPFWFSKPMQKIKESGLFSL